MGTASFLTILISSRSYKVAAAFLIGLGWSGIIQVARLKITKLVEAAFGEMLNER